MNSMLMMLNDQSARNILPREKIEKYGASALTNEELLAVILGSGSQDCNVFELSRRLSDFLSNQTLVPTLAKIREIRGLGKVKAAQVLACLELSKRYILNDKSNPVMTPDDLVSRLSFLKYEEQEHFVVVSLNSVNGVIAVHEITTGLVNKTPVHPREAFAKAIEDRAVSVVFAHNHPSGSLEPSQDDLSITRVLCASGRILQIPELFEKTFSPT